MKWKSKEVREYPVNSGLLGILELEGKTFRFRVNGRARVCSQSWAREQYQIETGKRPPGGPDIRVRNMPEPIATALRVAAARQGRTISAVAIEAIARGLDM